MAVSIVLAGGRRSELIPRLPPTATAHVLQSARAFACPLPLDGPGPDQDVPSEPVFAYPCEGSERLRVRQEGNASAPSEQLQTQRQGLS